MKPGDTPSPPSVAAGAVEATGLELHAQPDRTTRVTAQRWAVRQLDLRADKIAVDVASVAVSGLAARFEQGDPPRLLEASADEVRIEGLNAFLDQPQTGIADGGGLHLDALAGLDGVIHAFLTDALSIIDAEIVVPIAQGVVDFNQVVVEHIGPNSSLSVGARGIHIDAPHRARIDLFTFDGPGVRGATLEGAGPSRSRRRERGRLEVAPFLRGMLGAQRDAPLVRLADPKLERPLRGARVAGELRLGDGALGTTACNVILTGRAAGRNRVEVASAALGERVVLRAPALAASAATLAIGHGVVSTGALDAALDVNAIAKAGERPHGTAPLALAVAIREATLRDVKYA